MSPQMLTPMEMWRAPSPPQLTLSYTNHQDVFNCPVKGPPSAWMDIIERTPVNRQK